VPNWVDAISSTCLLLIAASALLQIDASESEKGAALQVFQISVVTLLAVAGLGVSANYLLQKLRRKQPSYCVFLSHHKQDASIFARLVKMQLEQQCGARSVFLDSDNLVNLDRLLETVKCNTGIVLAMLTGGYFSRMWCCAELVTAHRNSIPIVLVQFPGYMPPNENDAGVQELLAHWTTEQWHELYQAGIERQHVFECYQYLLTLEQLEYPIDESNSVQVAFLKQLLAQKELCSDISHMNSGKGARGLSSAILGKRSSEITPSQSKDDEDDPVSGALIL